MKRKRKPTDIINWWYNSIKGTNLGYEIEEFVRFVVLGIFKSQN